MLKCSVSKGKTLLYVEVLLGNASSVGIDLIFHNTQYKLRCESPVLTDLKYSYRLCSEDTSVANLVNHCCIMFWSDPWLAIRLGKLLVTI